MWECPDFFPLDGKQVLLTSPQEMQPVGLEFHAGNGTLCLIGDYNPQGVGFIRQNAQANPSLNAGQVYLAADRNVVVHDARTAIAL